MKKAILILMASITMLTSSALAGQTFKSGSPEAVVQKFLTAVQEGNMGDVYATTTSKFLEVYSDKIAKNCRKKALSHARNHEEIEQCLTEYDAIKVWDGRKYGDKDINQIILVAGKYFRTDYDKSKMGAKYLLKNTKNGWKIYKALK